MSRTFGFLQKVGQGPLALSITDFDMKLSISWVILVFLETFLRHVFFSFFVLKSPNLFRLSPSILPRLVLACLARKFKCRPANLNCVNLNGTHDFNTDKLKNLNFNRKKIISYVIKIRESIDILAILHFYEKSTSG